MIINKNSLRYFHRFYGVTVSTLDSESSDPSSNLGRTFFWYNASCRNYIFFNSQSNFFYSNSTDYKSSKFDLTQKMTLTWIEHAAFWSGIRRATIAPQSLLLKIFKKSVHKQVYYFAELFFRWEKYKYLKKTFLFWLNYLKYIIIFKCLWYL